MRLKDPAEHLSSSVDGKFEGGHDDDVCGEAGAGSVADHLDPSRLPPAQRQLFMRIRQKQHRDEINSKPISELTAKCEQLYSSFCLWGVV